MARRHGLRHTQLFTWRRELRQAAEAAGVVLPVWTVPKPLFVSAVIEPEPVTAAVVAPRKKRTRRVRSAAAVELVIDGVAVKIARGADATVIAAVIDALKTRTPTEERTRRSPDRLITDPRPAAKPGNFTRP